MKTVIQSLILSFALLFGVAACNNSSNTPGSKGDSAATLSSESHQHAYRCPMNCEKGKTYDKPGACPVCGMDLEHYDGGEDNGLTYTMQYSSNPAQLSVGVPATLSFIPRVVGNEKEAVALDLQHEKKIHLIIVSNDLSYFEHIHPDYQADGSYQIKVLGKGQSYNDGSGKNETRFDNGGQYVLFADYKPTGGAHQVEKIELDVAGTPKPATSFTTDKWSGTTGNYSVTLQPVGGKLITGTQMHIAAAVMKDGEEIDANSLENYLGAKAHMVVISLNEKEYLHVHPDVADGKFDLHTTFKKPGIYRGWIQFQAEGKVHTVDFTMNVKQGTTEDAKNAVQGHNAGGQEHSQH